MKVICLSNSKVSHKKGLGEENDVAMLCYENTAQLLYANKGAKWFVAVPAFILTFNQAWEDVHWLFSQ